MGGGAGRFLALHSGYGFLMSNDEEFRAVPISKKVPTYASAAHRVMHAYDRFQSLQGRLDAALNSWQSTLEFSVVPRTNERTEVYDEALFLADVENHAHDLSAIASEVVHHLRAALDHLAYNVTWRDAGTRNECAQFPIDTRTDVWVKRRNKMLKGATDEHLTWIEAAQPIRGHNQWLLQLKRLSNTDKHAARVEVVPALYARPDWGDVIGPDPERPGAHRVAVSALRLELLIYVPEEDRSIDTEPELAFPLLWNLIDNVRKVVNQFLIEEGLEPITVEP